MQLYGEGLSDADNAEVRHLRKSYLNKTKLLNGFNTNMPKDNHKAKDPSKEDDDKDSISLKKSRTLDSDIKEYKKRLDRYGEGEASSYDPYIDIEDKKTLSDIEEKSVNPVRSSRETLNPTFSRTDQHSSLRQATGSSASGGVKVEQEGEKIEGGKTKNENIGEFIKERNSHEKSEEENIPFIELLKHKKGDGGEPPPIYNPYISPARAKIPTYSPAPGGQIPPKQKKEPLSAPPPQVKAKDLEGELKETVERLSREHAELKQKLDYYQKNKTKVFEEREDLILKKNEIENVLNPLLKEEKKLEEEIRKIEKEEESISDEEQKRAREKERWGKEDRRQEIEHNKWKQADNLKEATKTVLDKSRTYDTLLAKEREAETKLKEVEKEKEAKETELRLLNIRKLKKDIDLNRTKLALQIKSFEDSLKRLTESENTILGEKYDIEEKESQAQGTPEEKIMEAKRWETEDKLRKVEQERWQISDKQKRLLEIMADISGQYGKIVKEEKETSEKLEKIKTVDKN